MTKLNFTQRRGGMMATIYIPIHITATDLEDLKRYAELYGYKRSEWRKVLASDVTDMVFNRVAEVLEEGEK